MKSTFCLGQFITPIADASPPPWNSDVPQIGFLQRGRLRVHVYCAPKHHIGDLSQTASEHLGPLLGPISTCSAPVSCNEIPPSDIGLIKLRAFIVTNSGFEAELRGCVFSRSENITRVQLAFAAAQIELTPIWNYNPAVFFEIPHVVIDQPSEDVTRRAWAEAALRRCRTQLKPHQLDALDFIRNNEYCETDPLSLWNDSANAWLRAFMYQCGCEVTGGDLRERSSRGSILADDMGLGKTLTTLTYVLATSDLAIEFLWDDWEKQSSATLVVCPVATLSNWENEIKMHFEESAIAYRVFHGPERKKLCRKDLQTSLVVLTTYEMISGSGNQDQLTIESLNLCWFRIVLDEAHLIRNPSPRRTQNIQQLQAKFVLLLTGTPIQNRLTDLQSLIAILRISPWDEEAIWKRCLIPQITVGAPEAIRSLNKLMQAICLRRTKAFLLNLPEKVEKGILVQNSPKWAQVSDQLHQSFIRAFGRLRTSQERWDPAEFFRQLTMIRQFCNHPIFAREDMLIQPNWHWQDSAKIVHLVDSLQTFLRGDRGIRRPKAVVFSSFVAFLEM
ncbi:hypothetical protein PTTG_30186 [Puccinia triticina 1-1 BBBD Race 1]|uniref:Helicase ATP-binding domain-containing protein n=1 Tax=Puccinia triticina (isolate 1-1 / race 1 (BBBD)) TaxID=630390 RepID=A0A180G0G9_PUCT1|nr:hypothetical protein PTTG_30186 [Puccinia triticina 1-1 BBBD Race 1]